jgi:type VI secretion system protein ImpG
MRASSLLEQDYQAELSYLRDAGRVFAEQHPALAGMLSERGADPDVERLLEGFAFLTARLRRRIDDAAPELGEALAEWLLPHLVRPQPAATMVEFKPAPRSLRGRLTVPQGARLYSRGAPRCTFTTSGALSLAPLRLVQQQLDDVSVARPQLRLQFELEAGVEPAALGDLPVRVHLHGEPATSAQLMLWLTQHLACVQVLLPDGRAHELGTRSLRVAAPAQAEPLFPWPDFSPHSARVLVESFALPAKFFYFDLLALQLATQLAGPCFTLALGFSRPPPLPARLPERSLRLHCVPAVNLFHAGAEPLRAGLAERAQLLRAVGVDPAHMEVFSVQSVLGIARDSQRRAYEPLHAFRGREGSGGFYKLQRRAASDDGTHTELSLHRDAEHALARGEETLSIELLCTNRQLARRLAPGDLCEPSADVPAGVHFENIGTVAPPVRPALGAELTWNLLGQLAGTRRGLADLQVLRGMLRMYAADPDTDDTLARMHRVRIDAIRAVRAETITRVLGGLAARGSLYEVELDERGFAGDGDAYMFGAMLHALFSIDARVNTFADLRVTLSPSARSFRFDAELPP